MLFPREVDVEDHAAGGECVALEASFSASVVDPPFHIDGVFLGVTLDDSFEAPVDSYQAQMCFGVFSEHGLFLWVELLVAIVIELSNITTQRAHPASAGVVHLLLVVVLSLIHI